MKLSFSKRTSRLIISENEKKMEAENSSLLYKYTQLYIVLNYYELLLLLNYGGLERDNLFYLLSQFLMYFCRLCIVISFCSLSVGD